MENYFEQKSKLLEEIIDSYKTMLTVLEDSPTYLKCISEINSLTEDIENLEEID